MFSRNFEYNSVLVSYNIVLLLSLTWLPNYVVDWKYILPLFVHGLGCSQHGISLWPGYASQAPSTFPPFYLIPFLFYICLINPFKTIDFHITPLYVVHY